ncbi:hypothetical protein [Williamsia muralis]|uniref:Uncharacterized protein n=1 Tax=Williamsia marianensis TaxID=85044 RepID=A0A2G3PFQ5_WILMA|nr:hypothetical protein [Williamsia marianensis]PHV64640.1 hypothetical protein CSW57_22845 [Williamsia marianensis]
MTQPWATLIAGTAVLVAALLAFVAQWQNRNKQSDDLTRQLAGQRDALDAQLATQRAIAAADRRAQRHSDQRKELIEDYAELVAAVNDLLIITFRNRASMDDAEIQAHYDAFNSSRDRLGGISGKIRIVGSEAVIARTARIAIELNIGYRTVRDARELRITAQRHVEEDRDHLISEIQEHLATFALTE